MKVCDKVRFCDGDMCGIITEDLGEGFVVIDTLFYGAYKVHRDNVTPMPDPEVLLVMTSSIPEAELSAFKKLWDEQTKDFKQQSIYKVPIIKDSDE